MCRLSPAFCCRAEFTYPNRKNESLKSKREFGFAACAIGRATRHSAATVIAVHGLEGSTDSQYMLGVARHGLAAGMNVVLMNQRNCGGMDHCAPTLYNSDQVGGCGGSCAGDCGERWGVTVFVGRVFHGGKSGFEAGG